MQKWEYLLVLGETDRWGFKPHFVNGQELKDWKKNSLFSLMSQLGNDGWELVCSLGYPGAGNFGVSGNSTELLFKRPKP